MLVHFVVFVNAEVGEIGWYRELHVIMSIPNSARISNRCPCSVSPRPDVVTSNLSFLQNWKTDLDLGRHFHLLNRTGPAVI